MKTPSPKALNLKKEIIKNIAHYMKFGGAEDKNDPLFDPDFDAGYSENEIQKCESILATYLSKVSNSITREIILREVKDCVLALNKLNGSCGGGLIETDQREMICELIILAANDAGLKTDEDITEEWREW